MSKGHSKGQKVPRSVKRSIGPKVINLDIESIKDTFLTKLSGSE